MADPEWLDQMSRDLSQRGISKYTYGPPAHRLAWKLGVNVRPPLFARFLTNASIFGIYFGAAWGCAMWLILWSPRHVPVHVAIWTSVVAGLLFGLAMALWYRYIARRFALPKWEQYCGQLEQ